MRLIGLPLASFSGVSSPIPAKTERPTLEEAVFGSSQRLMFQAMWSAPSSSPLGHMTPLRRLKVHVLRSSAAGQLSASIGLVILSGPVIAMYSRVWRVWFDI